MSASILDRARLYLRSCPSAVSGQGGHKATFGIVCAVVHGFALSAGEALDALREWNSRCLPPWSEHELRRKILSALNTPSRHPLGYLIERRTFANVEARLRLMAAE